VDSQKTNSDNGQRGDYNGQIQHVQELYFHLQNTNEIKVKNKPTIRMTKAYD